jgi:nitroreductase
MKEKNKPNYLAWQIKIQQFPARSSVTEQIKFLLGFGVLAPSGHNGQPWSFKLSNNTLNIFVNKQRALVKSDPEGRQLCLGIGCLIENLFIASDYFGLDSKVSYLQNTNGTEPIAEISFKKIADIKSDPGHLINFIVKRSSNRNKYKAQLPSKNFLQKLNGLSSTVTKIFILNEKEQNQKIADLTIEAQITAMENPDFRLELSELVKPNFTNSKIGMPGFAFGLPLPLSVTASFMIKKINMSKLNKKADEDVLKNFTPAFILIGAASDNKLSWLETGRLLERVWLMAEKEGLKCSINAAPVQSEHYQKQLQALLHTNFVPLVFMRIGYAETAASHTPRLNVSEVLA